MVVWDEYYRSRDDESWPDSGFILIVKTKIAYVVKSGVWLQDVCPEHSV